MKITFFIFSLRGGGAERITSYMANYWSSKEHQVSVITMTGEHQDSYPLSEDISIVRLQVDNESQSILSAITNNLNRVFLLRKKLKQIQPDVVIAMMPTANITAALATRGLNIRCVGSERNYPPSDQLGAQWSFLRKHVYRFLDCVVIQTEIGKHWIQSNTSARKTAVIPNPVVLPIPSFKPEIPVRKSPNRKIILGVGRLTKQKQFDHLINAFAMIADKHQQFDLVILGEGGERTKLESLIMKTNLSDRISLPGRAGNISEWFNCTDLFVLSSNIEGFPNALLEAMSHAVPCVSYDCLTGPAEIITHGENGLLVQADSIGELSLSIDQVISDEQTHVQCLINANNIKQKYSLSNIMKSWDNVIDGLFSVRLS